MNTNRDGPRHGRGAAREINKKQSYDISKNYNYKKIHLIESKQLIKKEIECFLNESEKYINFNKKIIKKTNLLEGRSIFNLFFEDSTRTRTSFEVAAKRLGADLKIGRASCRERG